MKMKYWPFLMFLFITCIEGQDLSNLLNTTTHQCIRCLCHAVSGCYLLQNCARYTINYDYWVQAGSPRVDIDDGLNEQSYNACIQNDNCILHTINNYTNKDGLIDCNCDGEFNCEDRFALHYNKCEDPMSIKGWQVRKSRFRSCSGLQMDDPVENCIPQAV